jgi:hypothetical protein
MLVQHRQCAREPQRDLLPDDHVAANAERRPHNRVIGHQMLKAHEHTVARAARQFQTRLIARAQIGHYDSCKLLAAADDGKRPRNDLVQLPAGACIQARGPGRTLGEPLQRACRQTLRVELREHGRRPAVYARGFRVDPMNRTLPPFRNLLPQPQIRKVRKDLIHRRLR